MTGYKLVNVKGKLVHRQIRKELGQGDARNIISSGDNKRIFGDTVGTIRPMSNSERQKKYLQSWRARTQGVYNGAGD